AEFAAHRPVAELDCDRRTASFGLAPLLAHLCLWRRARLARAISGRRVRPELRLLSLTVPFAGIISACPSALHHACTFSYSDPFVSNLPRRPCPGRKRRRYWPTSPRARARTGARNCMTCSAPMPTTPPPPCAGI